MKKLLIFTAISFAFITAPAYASTRVVEHQPAITVKMAADDLEEEVVETPSITMEDKNGDGIPDIIEDYYNENIRDKYMFGITLGSLISFAISIVGQIAIFVRNGKANKKMLTLGDSNSRSIAKYEETINRLSEENEKREKKYQKELAETRKREQLLIAKIDELVVKVEPLATLGEKMDILLLTGKHSTFNREDIRKGKTSEIVAAIDEVIDNGSGK